MSTATHWWWIRHAPVTGHDGRLYGRTEVAVDLSNSDALSTLAFRLPQNAAWIATPLSRTQKTAAALAETLAAAGRAPAAPAIEPEFIDQDFGSWQGMSYGEIDAALGTEREQFWYAPANLAPHGGESFAQVIARVAPTIKKLTRDFASREIVVVAHAGVIRAALALALDLAPDAALRIVVETLSLTRIDHILGRDGRESWRVVETNDRCHFRRRLGP